MKPRMIFEITVKLNSSKNFTEFSMGVRGPVHNNITKYIFRKLNHRLAIHYSNLMR